MDTVEIYSIPLTAALRMQGIAPISFRKDQGNRTVFVFARTPELTVIYDGFRDGSLTVPARQFANAIFDVKREYLARGY